MENNAEDLIVKLKKNNIKPSQQRIKILEYIATHPCHPTADQVFCNLKKNMPTLSKATVYNTLNAFVRAQIVREITIEENEIRYEYNMENHGHFKCEECGTIYDFAIDINSFSSTELKECKINARDVYFKGICKKCLMAKN